ncbi:hypothetical protein N7474_006076 [Penicillium riverlandense]|uniref:uncharacterized protein n=1 Tax=Penicillium riverlandense TaxID=1903569 RepID=UPI002546AA48|nr:uncharacterized protein N7474_006076 [Penicillium riverlandense]KAJ5820485.1 hypothetical protein N7474_006076 [Penicillium riverlandense]
MDDALTRKRPRPVVSCLRCREKKLKCDRVAPCQNCIKAGCPAGCFYDPGAPFHSLSQAKRTRHDDDIHRERDLQPGSRHGAAIGIIEDLQQRVIRLEEQLSIVTQPACLPGANSRSAFEHGRSSQQIGTSLTQSSYSAPQAGTILVKGSRTRYQGQNSRLISLNQFGEAKAFIGQCTKDPTLLRLAKDVQFLQNKSEWPMVSSESNSHLESSPEILQLRISLPSKTICDNLLDSYAKNFEKALRILHVPSFQRRYTEFWDDPDHEIYHSSAFIPQLTAVLAVAVSLEDHNMKLGNPSAWEYLKLSAVNLIQEWHRKLSRKQRTELATLQVEALLILARRLQQVSSEEVWRASGTLVRSAMAIGLHVDPSTTLEISAFQAEIRRRLWITIMEIDLQTSTESGMPVMTPGMKFGHITLANIDDCDFDESTTEIPASRPLHEWTDSLSQITLFASLPHRMTAMSCVGNGSSEIDFDELLKHGRQLEACLQQIPSPLKMDYVPPKDNEPGFLLNRVLLDVYTRRPLLCLYQSLAREGDCDNPAFSEIQRVCLESSLVTLSFQDCFDPNVADLDVFHSNAYWDIFQILFKSDILSAALNVCGYLKSAHAPEQNRSVVPSAGGIVYTKASLTRTVENALDGLTRKIGDTGNSFKDVFLLAVVLQSVRARGPAPAKERGMYEGAKNALLRCRQHLLPDFGEQSLGLDSLHTRHEGQSSKLMLTSEAEPQPTSESHPEMSDATDQLSTLAEFNLFQSDPFLLGLDGSFAWDP